MRVLLVGNYEADAQESMQRFAAFMLRGLRKAGHEARIVRPRVLLGQLNPSSEGFGKWLGYVDKFGSFPSVLKSQIHWADVVHICDHSNAFYTKYLRFVPHIVTCHDLMAVRSALGEIPQHPTRWTGKKLQRMILNGLTKAQHVACASEATRKDFLRIVGFPEERVSRVYNSLTYPYSRMEKHEAATRLRELRIDPSELFLLHVGGNQWYKNRLGVLRIFAVLSKTARKRTFKLVMVGKPWTAEMRQFIRESGIGDLTLEFSGVSDEDLQAIYSTATMMLFPSLEEGFGWPIVEAQACGCPVATSKRPSMDEIAGDAAIYIDPDNPILSAAIVNQALDKADNMRESSLANAGRFRTGMIEGYLSLYDKVLAEKTATSLGELDKPMTRRSRCSTVGM